MKPLAEWTIHDLIDYFFGIRNLENNLNLTWSYNADMSVVIAFDRTGNPAMYPIDSLAPHVVHWAYRCHQWSETETDSDASQPPIA